MTSLLRNIVLGVVLVLAAVCAYLYSDISRLHEQQAVLTTRLQDATNQLEKEIERGKRVEEATVRLEKAAAERREQTLQYERELQDAADPALDVVIPDLWLRPSKH